MKKEIIEFSRQVWNKDELENIIDSYVEEIKDLSDTAIDIAKPIKAFISIYQLGQKIKFRRFLKSYAKEIDKSFKSESELTNKLTEYLKSERNLNFIYNTIDSALNANSTLCSGILGYYTGVILSEQKKLGFYEMVYLNALKHLNDFELLLTIGVIENVDDWTKNQTVVHNKKFSTDIESYEFAVQRLKGLQIIKEIHGSPGNPVSLGQSFWGTYRLNNISKGFYELIKKSGYYDEIMKV